MGALVLVKTNKYNYNYITIYFCTRQIFTDVYAAGCPACYSDVNICVNQLLI